MVLDSSGYPLRPGEPEYTEEADDGTTLALLVGEVTRPALD